MQITSYGAVREVTGSMHLLTTTNDRILLDCGMFQGKRKESDEKNRNMEIDPKIITNVVLSHAHVDHCGRIPILTKNGFPGRIISTRVTADACDYLLRDCGHIQESDAVYLNYKTVRSFLYKLEQSSKKKPLPESKLNAIKKRLKTATHRIDTQAVDSVIKENRLHAVEPIYTAEDAEHSLGFFEGYPYREPITVGKDVTCTFFDAGHIIGSASVLLEIKENGKVFRILYSGDIGRSNRPIINDPDINFPKEDRKIDLLIMESTYGDRIHGPIEGVKDKLKHILEETNSRGGSIIIPAFAFGRTQELIYMLHEIYDEGGIKRLPIYIDSPLAGNLTRVFGEHPEVYDDETHKTFLEKGKNPFMFDKIHFIQSVEESMDLLNKKEPNIVISASGMCEAGRILHHLRYKIHNPNNTILLVGYMAEHTLGRRIKEEGLKFEQDGRKGDAPIMKFMDKTYPLNARVRELEGFSGHADKNELLSYLKNSKLDIAKIALVHGEEDQMIPFGSFLEQNGYKVCIPRKGESITLK